MPAIRHILSDTHQFDYPREPVTRVDISYSTTGGCSWIPIATLNSNPGSYTWVVPALVDGVNCRVRVQLFNGKTALGDDSSNHAFTIAQ